MSGDGQHSFVLTQRDVFGVAFVFCLLVAVTMTSFARADEKPSPLLDNLPHASDTEFRLVMVAIEGCPFCMRWQSQVGHLYPKSAEAKRVPLVKVRFGSKTLAGFKKIKYTPTFLVLRGQTEIGRIAGYPGADPFWEELGIILNKHDAQPDPTNKARP